MKIREGVGNSAKVHDITGMDDKKVSSNSGTAFKSHLRHFENHSAEERIQLLVGQIQEQGEKLSKKIDLRELKIYKSLISEFLDEALNNSRKFSKDSRLDRRGRFKVFATVKKINEELDALTNDVLNTEKDNIRILQRIEDIRGLVLDLSL
ncbi:MAG: YaaR family protein [Clostridiaceae bacterium]|nr:YaaR family protein [Clostridiaceae bacterium]